MPDRWSWLLGRRSDEEGGTETPDQFPTPPDHIRTKASTASARLMDVPLSMLDPNPFQPRTVFNPEDLAELSASIKQRGVLQPVALRQWGERYQIIAGERRARAAELAGLETVPAIVVEADDSEMAVLALVENLQRKDLNAIEEAEGFRRAIDAFQLTQEELATRVGKSQAAVANKLRLLKLAKPIRDGISREIISERHARALLALDSEEAQVRALEEIVRRQLTVRETETLIHGMIDDGEGRSPKGKARRVVRLFKDFRLFRNSLLALVREMEKAGAEVEVDEENGSDFYEVKVRMHRRSSS